MPLEVGSPAPDFSVPDQTGTKRSLSEFKGMWVLLYFYPEDDTPGCTIEACGIRDAFEEFKELECMVLGVSPDGIGKHKAFISKYGLPFPLLADEAKEISTLYGAWREKIRKDTGEKYMGIARSSFLIDPKGNIAKIYQAVMPEAHTEQVIKDLRILRKL